MTTDAQMDATWSGLSELDATARQQSMEERFARLASKAEAERFVEAEAMVRAEYALDDMPLQDFTVSRLRAWIALSKRDPAQASAAVKAYDHVFDHLPAEMAMKRASVVQTVARAQLSSDEIEALFDLIPSLVRQLPRAKQEHDRSTASQARVEAARQGTAARAKKPFWKFW